MAGCKPSPSHSEAQTMASMTHIGKWRNAPASPLHQPGDKRWLTQNLWLLWSLHFFFPALNDASYFTSFSHCFWWCLLCDLFGYLWQIWAFASFHDCKEALSATQAVRGPTAVIPPYSPPTCCRQVIKPEGQGKYFASVWVNKKGDDRQGSNHRVTEGSPNANTPNGLYAHSNSEIAMSKLLLRCCNCFFAFFASKASSYPFFSFTVHRRDFSYSSSMISSGRVTAFV